MTRTSRDIFGRLGPAGLTRVLDDLLDQQRLIRLAHACALEYPGMRARSQKRGRLLRDLVEKAGHDEAARRAILKALQKETAGPARDWARLSPEGRVRRIREHAGGGNGELGLDLFLAAASPAEGEMDGAVDEILARVPAPSPAEDAEEPAGDLPAEAPEVAPEPDAAQAPTPPAPSREADRLRKRAAEQQKKIQYLESQLARAREEAKALKHDLMLRKGELAESRMLAERLSRELEGARPVQGAGKPAAAPEEVAEIARTVRKLASEQRKLLHGLEKLLEAPAPSAELPVEALAPLQSALDEIRKDAAVLRKEIKKDEQGLLQKLDEVKGEVRVVRTTLAESQRGRVARRKGEPERVGIFVDVQNVYYGARQLKGKLDFDALLSTAVRDRRLIQATAYVVESKEIDQSGFIAMLQQRGIEVRRKPLKVRSDGSMKGDWDMEMALDILDFTPRLDVVVLVSGDGDFTSLVHRVKAMGPQVEVIAFPRNTAKSLQESADRFQPLDRKFMIRQEPGPEEKAPAPEKPVKAEAAPPEPAPEKPTEKPPEDTPAPAEAVGG